MNYLRLYESIIEQGKYENRQKGDGRYYENHHIYPKCLCNEELSYLVKDSRNLVLLTAREHYLSHWLLAKVFDDSKMWFAFWNMCNVKGKKMDERKYKISSKFYEKARIEYIKYASKFQRSNTNEFIEKVTKIHNGLYDYSKTEYKHSKDKVTIICSNHGEFEQIPDSHLRGNGCSKCNDEKTKKRCSKKIIQYTLQGNYIKNWNSMADVERELYINHSDISTCCNGKQKSAGGFIWCYKGEEPNDYHLSKHKGKKIIQYDLFGNYIKIWNSAKKAAKNLNINAGNISSCCNSVRKSAGGYYWRHV